MKVVFILSCGLGLFWIGVVVLVGIEVVGLSEEWLRRAEGFNVLIPSCTWLLLLHASTGLSAEGASPYSEPCAMVIGQ